MNRDRFTRLSAHPTDLELARLLERDTPPDLKVAGHLAGCRRCMAVYAEFVHAHAGAQAEAATPVPDEWLRRGLQVAATPPAGVRPRPAAPRRLVPRGALLLTAAACALLMVTVGVDRLRVRQAHEVLAGQLRQDSYGGLLYGEAFRPNPSGRRGLLSDPRVDDALAELVRRDARGARSAGDAFWLVAGCLARNDLDNADAHLREARRRYADDDRLASLGGVLAYKRNALAEAASALAAALERRRSPTHLYNLALVRRAQGDSAAAQALYGELAARFPESMAAGLARTRGQAPPVDR